MTKTPYVAHSTPIFIYTAHTEKIFPSEWVFKRCKIIKDSLGESDWAEHIVRIREFNDFFERVTEIVYIAHLQC